MGNIYSLYQNYKNDYDELEDKYNKLKVKHDSDKTKIDVLNETIKTLENDTVKKQLTLDNEIEENRINKKKIETLISSQESDIINSKHVISNLEDRFGKFFKDWVRKDWPFKTVEFPGRD